MLKLLSIFSLLTIGLKAQACVEIPFQVTKFDNVALWGHPAPRNLKAEALREAQEQCQRIRCKNVELLADEEREIFNSHMLIAIYQGDYHCLKQ